MMFLMEAVQLTFLLVPLHGLLPNDLKKTEAVDLDYDTIKDNLEDLPPSCDLTKNYCDINCCNDEDCSEAERASFDCKQGRGSEVISVFGSHYCDNIGSQHLEARAILCLQQANSPYLGEFHVEDEAYSQNTIPNILQSRKKQVITFMKQSDHINNSISEFHYYYYGSQVLKYESETKKSGMYLPFNILKQRGFCTERPLRYMINSNSICMHTLSEKACSNNAVFKLSNFISSGLQVYSGDGDRTINIEPEIHCFRNGTEYVSFFKNIVSVSGSSEKNNDEIKCSKPNYSTRLNKNTKVCENVVVSLKYYFHRNQTSLLHGKVIILLADIPLTVNSFLQMYNARHKLIESMSDSDEPYMYSSQFFSVIFTDDDELSKTNKSRGYKLNDLLKTNTNYSSLS